MYVKNRRQKQESKTSNKNASAYWLLVFLGFCGIYSANKLYPNAHPAPDYEDLEITNGKLVSISTYLGRRGGIQIKVEDDRGTIARFPSDGGGSLRYSKSDALRIKERCIDKPISVKWYKEKRLIFGSLVGAWEIRTCDNSLDLSYKKTKRVRDDSLTVFRFFCGIGLLIFSFCFWRFLLNYKKAKLILNNMKDSL